MAKTGEKGNKLANSKVADCIKERTKKTTSVRKKYSSKGTELQVRKRTVVKAIIPVNENCETNNLQYNLLSKTIPSEATMFFPPCPQYYPISTNEWSPVIPIQCPLYSLQHIPVIVNSPLLSTQIRPYPMIVAPPTVANEYEVSPLVSTNEFVLHVSEVPPCVSMNEPATIYCEMPPIAADLTGGFLNLAICNEVNETPLDTFTLFTNELAAAVTPSAVQCSVSCDFSPAGSTIADIFQPIPSTQVPNEFIPICNSVCNEMSPLSSCSYDSSSFEYFNCDLPVIDENTHEAEIQEYEHYVENSLEFYLSLPKDLFPTAGMMTIDPNTIIDEFCKVPNLDDHSWILDLEFGVPKTPVTRRVATYNVKLNSIHCKNVPEAIHPGFEGCHKDLKRALMFYYDCVISNWYRGYIALSCDRSVENFQSWLLLPMQVLGMCWP